MLQSVEACDILVWWCCIINKIHILILFGAVIAKGGQVQKKSNFAVFPQSGAST